MPGLVLRPLERHVEADLDDLVVGTSTASHMPATHGWVTRSTKPEKSCGWISTYQRRGPRRRRTRPLNGRPEGRHHVLTHGFGPFAREGTASVRNALRCKASTDALKS